MHSIHVLDHKVIDKIAAGEVIERPASIVKELVENSIDANASAITVEIKEGGKKQIKVTDNGVGIPKDQVKKAFIRHATSKINTEADIDHIISLGFRGEALASIVAVSEVEMCTKVFEDETGIGITISGGDIRDFKETAASSGTSISVNHLFYNVPARKKFLKIDQTEAREIADLVNKLALAYPEISFKLINNDKLELYTAGNHELRHTILDIYGKEIARELIQVTENVEGVSIEGYIGSPGLLRGSKIYETFFVNGRYVKSSLLSEALIEGYYGYLMKGKFPFCVLNIRVNPEDVDVNVHPAKTEIRFKHEQMVFEIVSKQIQQILRGEDLTAHVSLDASKKESVVLSGEKPEIVEEICLPHFKEPDREEMVEERTLREPERSYQRKAEEEPKLSGMPIRNYKIVGQVFDTYWVMEQEENIYIIDQHAAHEKVLFERLIASRKNQSVASQLLLEPILLNLVPREVEVLEKNKEAFRKFGFLIEEFGINTYVIKEIPSLFGRLMNREKFMGILDELIEEKYTANIKTFDDLFANICCKRAIKANDRRTDLELKRIIEDLMTLENPFNCPHGRPIIINITKTELEKKFKRIVS